MDNPRSKWIQGQSARAWFHDPQPAQCGAEPELCSAGLDCAVVLHPVIATAAAIATIIKNTCPCISILLAERTQAHSCLRRMHDAPLRLVSARVVVTTDRRGSLVRWTTVVSGDDASYTLLAARPKSRESGADREFPCKLLRHR